MVRASVAGKVLEGKHFLYWNSRVVDVTGVDAHMQIVLNDNYRETLIFRFKTKPCNASLTSIS